MTIYWRLQDIPELQMVPRPRRRRLWSDAVTRSFRVRYLLFMLITPMLGFVASLLLLHLLWPAAHVWAWAIAWIPLGIILDDFGMTQPRARRWLREHAGELDRYVGD